MPSVTPDYTKSATVTTQLPTTRVGHWASKRYRDYKFLPIDPQNLELGYIAVHKDRFGYRGATADHLQDAFHTAFPNLSDDEITQVLTDHDVLNRETGKIAHQERAVISASIATAHR